MILFCHARQTPNISVIYARIKTRHLRCRSYFWCRRLAKPSRKIIKNIEQTESCDEELIIANPRRPEGIPRVGDIAKEQITWEHRNLQLARVVMFYFVKGPGIITPLELGKELGRGSPIVLGIDKSFDRPFDIETQAHLERPELPIYRTLDETVVAAAALARQIRAKES